ncbi:alpha-tocopherol transfer protein-like [Anopheles cruzii]|uniref:alpha-tocopherol transfer protein-like n=1 Tax=Anopheles cruzii TaxID=68878 RepID=UPI0022EC7DCF|nr:alpha-tocopherol transfer protein-like [Anopheles cruzii]
MSDLRPISPQLMGVARLQLNEDAAQVNSHLVVIRSWLVECDLHCTVVSDQFLVAFLRGCKFSLEKVKKKLALFYRIRAELPQVIQNRDPTDEHVLSVIRMGVAVPLPKTEKPTDPKLFLIRVGQFDVTQCTFADIMKVGTMLNDILMRDDDQMVVCGVAIIIDMKGVTGSHLLQFEIELLKKIATLNQDASPLRMQGFHILNPPPGLQTALSIFNGLLSEKNQQKRIFTHGSDLESLHKHFPATLLPAEYGGSLGSIDSIINEWELKLIHNRAYLSEMAALTSSKNLSLTHNPDTIGTKSEAHFGFEGSFRKLDID